MIFVSALLGLMAGVAVYFFYPPLYESNAKLLVRYVLDRRAVDSIDNPTNSTTLGVTTDSVISSEVEILTSWDLAVQVAEAIGPQRLLHSKDAPTKEAAAASVSKELKVTARPGISIIYVAYQNRDPQLATLVLNELLNRYFIKHLEVHRSAGAFDFVSQQSDQVRARLNQTEDALKEAKAKVGIVSLADGSAALSAELMKTEEQLHLRKPIWRNNEHASKRWTFLCRPRLLTIRARAVRKWLDLTLLQARLVRQLLPVNRRHPTVWLGNTRWS
jgi:uncharacterized protein involved in exopolysaccharide biosynthesis